jgi:hypothetical protein
MNNYRADAKSILEYIRSKASEALFLLNWTQSYEERICHHNYVVEYILSFFSKYPPTNEQYNNPELIELLNTLKDDSILALEINWDLTENRVDAFESQLYLIREFKYLDLLENTY